MESIVTENTCQKDLWLCLFSQHCGLSMSFTCLEKMKWCILRKTPSRKSIKILKKWLLTKRKRISTTLKWSLTNRRCTFFSWSSFCSLKFSFQFKLLFYLLGILLMTNIQFIKVNVFSQTQSRWLQCSLRTASLLKCSIASRFHFHFSNLSVASMLSHSNTECFQRHTFMLMVTRKNWKKSRLLTKMMVRQELLKIQIKQFNENEAK